MRPPRFAMPLLLAALTLGCKPDDTDTEDTDTEDTDTGDTDTSAPVFVCPADDPNEEDDALGTANDLADGVHQDGIICEDDADWYSFSAPAGCLAAATLILGEDAGDLDLILYDAAQEPLDGSFFGETVEEVEWFNRTGLAQALYLEVTGYLGDDGNYAIKYSCTAADCTGDEASEPDSFTDPNALGADTSFPGKICYGDSDWFEIPFGAGCSVDILLDYAAVSGDLDLYLYDAEGEPLDASQSSDDDDDLQWTNDAGDTTLFVEVYGVDLANTTYALSFTDECPFTCPEDDANEPDDAFADPTPLADGVEQAAIVCASDVDWYSFTAPPGCLAAATVTFGPGAGDLDLALFDDQQVRLDESLFGVAIEDVEWFNRTASPQALYLEVAGYLTAEGSYAIEYSCTQVSCDDDEAGEPDAADDANPLAADASFDGSICYGDSDWFEIELASDCVADILLDYAYIGGDLDMFLYDALGNQLGASQSDDDDEAITFTNGPLGQSVFVEVFGHDLANNTYGLSYSAVCPATCPDDDANESDDTQATATELLDRVPQEAIVCENNADWYGFTMTPGCVASAAIVFPVLAGDLDLEIFDVDGELLDGSYGGVLAEGLQYYSPSGGDVFLKVTGYGGAEGNYTIAAWCTEGDCVEEAGEPDSFEEAKLVDDATPVPGQVCYADADWYEIPADLGCTLDMVVAFDHAGGDLEANLYHQSGLILDSSYSSDDNEEFLDVAGLGESLFLEVIAYGATSNDYVVTVTRECVPVCEDVPANDDSGLTATAITAPSTTTGQICLSDDDWYSFNVGMGCVADFTLEEVSIDLDMLLYDEPDAHPLDFVSREGATTVAPEHLRITNSGPAKDFWLWVYAFGDYGESDYTLTYEEACVDCGEVPEDDNQAQAQPLAPLVEIPSTACGDEDWFSITTTPGCNIDVDMEYENVGSGPDVYLRDATATVATATGTGAAKSLLYTNNVSGGTYYIRVVPFNGISQYHLDWSEICPP